MRHSTVCVGVECARVHPPTHSVFFCSAISAGVGILGCDPLTNHGKITSCKFRLVNNNNTGTRVTVQNMTFMAEEDVIPPAAQLRCTGNGEPRRCSRGLIYHAEARRFPCSSASCCASPTMGWTTTTDPMAAPAHLRAGSGRRSLRPLASRAASVPRAPSAAQSPRRTG